MHAILDSSAKELERDSLTQLPVFGAAGRSVSRQTDGVICPGGMAVGVGKVCSVWARVCWVWTFSSLVAWN